MKRTEQVLWVLFWFTIGIKMTTSKYGFFPFTAGMILSSFYFYLSFWLFNNISFTGIFKKENYVGITSMRIIGTIAIGFGYSTAVMSILFKIMSWPGSLIMLIQACFGLVVSAIVILVRQSRKGNNPFYIGLLWRNVLMIAICGILIGIYALPAEQQTKIFHNHIRP